MLSKKY